jgi:hypothetical protein
MESHGVVGIGEPRVHNEASCTPDMLLNHRATPRSMAIYWVKQQSGWPSLC